jgi:predicted DNA-binding transcriptional regulator AlpA
MTQRYLTQKQVAAYLGICVRSIQYLRKAGTFPEPVSLTPYILRWSEAELERWLADKQAAQAKKA